MAEALHREAGVPMAACGLEEIAKFQQHLTDYHLVVLSMEHAGQVIFKGPKKQEEKLLILIKQGDHFHACTSLPAFFGKGGYCLECKKAFAHNRLGSHRCQGQKCTSCCQSSCPRQPGMKPTTYCQDCHRKFFGAQCLANHRQFQEVDGRPATKDKQSVCQTKRKCGHCSRLLQPEELKRGHTCNTFKCPSCHKWQPQNHKCFIQVAGGQKRPNTSQQQRGHIAENDEGNSSDKEEEGPIMVDWDAETMQGDGVHVANLICTQSTHAPGTKFEWYDQSCVEEFVDLLLGLAEGEDRVIAVAHNGKGFDHHLIVDHLYNVAMKFEQVGVSGKILAVKVGRVTFKDSLCFIGIPLAGFPKAFGITEEKKGFFPHHFNIPEHQQYVGAIPAVDYYDPEGMSTERRKEFEQWYAEQKESGREFNFMEELKSYCHSDVSLLKAGRETFCQGFAEVAGFDPFVKCLTIASSCNLFYRQKNMPRNKIASEPAMGWQGQRKALQ